MSYKRGKVGLGITALTLTSILVQAKAHAANLIDLTYGVGAGSFELGIENFVPDAATDAMSNPPGDTVITGWTVGDTPDGGVNWIREPRFQADTGEYSVDLQDLRAGSIFTEIPTIVGSLYTVSFAATTVQGRAQEGVVSAGSLIDQQFTVPFGAGPNDFANQSYTPFSFQFTALDTTTQLTFSSLGGNSYGPVIDSVSVEIVPEPSTILGIVTALGLGVLSKNKGTEKS